MIQSIAKSLKSDIQARRQTMNTFKKSLSKFTNKDLHAESLFEWEGMDNGDT